MAKEGKPRPGCPKSSPQLRGSPGGKRTEEPDAGTRRAGHARRTLARQTLRGMTRGKSKDHYFDNVKV